MDNHQEIPLAREPAVDNLVLVTGFIRSGKALLAPLVSSLERAEIVRLHYEMEQIPILHWLGNVSDNTATYLIRHAINFMLYDMFLGREVNFRPSDFTSVWKSTDPKKYIQRLHAPEGDCVYEQIVKENPILVLMVHNGLWHSNIYFKAFPEAKIIHTRRNPVDIIYSWKGKNYGGEFFKKPRSCIVSIPFGDDYQPYYTKGWQQEYANLSGVDRIIQMIHRVRQYHKEVYLSLSPEQKKKVLIVTHEELAQDPDKVLGEVCTFLGTKTTTHTPFFMEKENCPRVIDPKEQEKKVNEIKEEASKEGVELLESMIDDYQNNAESF